MRESQVREIQEREVRVQLLSRQLGRRMFNRDLTLGWTAWHDRWEAKRYALMAI